MKNREKSGAVPCMSVVPCPPAVGVHIAHVQLLIDREVLSLVNDANKARSGFHRLYRSKFKDMEEFRQELIRKTRFHDSKVHEWVIKLITTPIPLVSCMPGNKTHAESLPGPTADRAKLALEADWCPDGARLEAFRVVTDGLLQEGRTYEFCTVVVLLKKITEINTQLKQPKLDVDRENALRTHLDELQSDVEILLLVRRKSSASATPSAGVVPVDRDSVRAWLIEHRAIVRGAPAQPAAVKSPDTHAELVTGGSCPTAVVTV